MEVQSSDKNRILLCGIRSHDGEFDFSDCSHAGTIGLVPVRKMFAPQIRVDLQQEAQEIHLEILGWL